MNGSHITRAKRKNWLDYPKEEWAVELDEVFK